MIAVAATAGKNDIARRATEGICEPFKLYYTPCTEIEDGELHLFPHWEIPPAPWILATEEGLECNIPYDRYFQWISERSKRLSVLAWNR